MDQKSTAVSDADRLRSLSGILVFLRRSLEVAALSRDARHHRRDQGMAEPGSNLRTFALYRGILQAHRGERLGSDACVFSGDSARGTGCPVSRVVEKIQRSWISRIRNVTADPYPRVGSTGHRHVHRDGIGGDL